MAQALEPRRVLRASALAALLLVVSCGGDHATAPAPVVPPPPPPKVLVISVDGLRPDALQRVGATHILGLADRGTYTWQAQTIFPSTTLPSHSSMLSGYEPDAHGIDFNDYRASYTFPVPTVFALARQAGFSTAMVVGKPKFEQLRAAGGVDSFTIPAGGDAAIADQA
ncbi:MAG TPA: alkaline phosphatase family protein, partial [Vicinamibacteria bacterium]|nr:alkaline phosphatase family protein [Vicinamibacteria bacterium]